MIDIDHKRRLRRGETFFGAMTVFTVVAVVGCPTTPVLATIGLLVNAAVWLVFGLEYRRERQRITLHQRDRA